MERRLTQKEIHLAKVAYKCCANSLKTAEEPVKNDLRHIILYLLRRIEENTHHEETELREMIFGKSERCAERFDTE